MTDPEASDLDALVRRVDPDRWLSSRFVADASMRADVVALYAFDHELARAPKVASNALLGEIRLALWREVLDEIEAGGAVRRHPTAQALAEAVRRRGLARGPLEAMIDARYRELDPAPLSSADAIALATGSAHSCASLAIAILDPERWEFSTFVSGWSGIWALSLLVLAGRVVGDARREVEAEVRVNLAEARTIERGGATPAMFPAVAHAALADSYLKARAPGELEKRLRLTWAVARGRI